MTVRLAVDKIGTALLDDYDALMHNILRPLEFLQATFGDLGYEELTFVTTPRGFSQSLQGLVTLSALMMSDAEEFQRAGFTDPRTVVAHEIAHQWWGHRVTWVHDRDQWLSEALADYSAELYAREGLGDLGGWDSPTEGWLSEVLRPAASLSVFELGPVVLGDRLNSSLSSNAYVPIVYKKGAVVVQMLAGLIGTDRFKSDSCECVGAAQLPSRNNHDVARCHCQWSGHQLGSVHRSVRSRNGLAAH